MRSLAAATACLACVAPAALLPAAAAAEGEPAAICIQPLGAAAADDIARIRAGLAVVLGLHATVLPQAPLPEDAWCSDTFCDADGLLRLLHGPAFRRCARVLAVTTRPLLHPFGRAQGVGELPIFRTWYGNVVALVSTHRMTTVSSARNRELISLALHELAHTFGLHHCADRRCMMWREYEWAAAADLRPLGFCDRCQAGLRAAGQQAHRGPFTFWPASQVVTRAERAAQRRARWQPSASTRRLLDKLEACGPRCTEKSLGHGADVFLAP